MCAGVGVAVCTKQFKTDGSANAYYTQVKSNNNGEETSTSATVTYSFEYTTSDDIEKAGNRSDMFLTPSLNVKFSKSAEISLNKATCAVAYKEIVTWNLESETNVWVSYFAISI
jgi:hypothetical protein